MSTSSNMSLNTCCNKCERAEWASQGDPIRLNANQPDWVCTDCYDGTDIQNTAPTRSYNLAAPSQ